MPGPRPKDPAARRRRNEPARGEWVDLTGPAPDPLHLGSDREWSPRTQTAWLAWWADPVSSQWTPADRDLVLHLAEIHENWITRPSAIMAAEIRQLRDILGLSPKGRQDRRWRIGEGAATATDETPAPTPRRLRAVA